MDVVSLYLMALDSYWHRKGPFLSSGKTAGALERVKSRAEGGRTNGMGQRTGEQWMRRVKEGASKEALLGGQREAAQELLVPAALSSAWIISLHDSG